MKAKSPVFAELKRRNVIRMAGLYLVGAWLIVQVLETVLPTFDVPVWVLRATIILLAIGFLPAMVFAWIFELTPQGLKRDEDVPFDQSSAPVTARRMDRMLLAVSVLAIAYFAFDKFVLAPQREAALVTQTTAQISAEATAEKSKANANSIAVLPFANMSGDAANEYFSDGISEEILNVLASVPELKVAARTSSFSFKGKSMEVPEIAKALNVRMVLEGSVRKQDDTVRVTAQLINAETGFHLWSQTYDRKLADIFAVQDEIARSIGDELKVKVAGASIEGDNSSGTRSVEAYDHYLRGMAVWHQRGGENLWAAIEQFGKALAIDPDYAQAYAGKALAYAVLASYSERISWGESLKRSDDNALRALALDPNLPESYAALANSSSTYLQTETALALLRRAIVLRPSFSTAHHWLGNVLLTGGDISGSVVELKRAADLDPLSPVIADNLSFALIASGENAEAKEVCTRSLDVAPDHPGCLQYEAMVDLMSGEFDAARALLQHRAAVLNPSASGQAQAIVNALTGKADRHALAQKLAALPFNSSVIPTSGNSLEDQVVAQLLMMLGEPNFALDYIERNASELGSTMTWAVMLPQMDPIRCEPRFVAIVKELKATDPYFDKVCKEKPNQ